MKPMVHKIGGIVLQTAIDICTLVGFLTIAAALFLWLIR